MHLENVQNILVRGTNWIGDVVMTFPALHSIRKTFPQAHIAVLVKPWVSDLFQVCPDIDEIILYESPGRHEGLSGLWSLSGELRKRKFDCAILLQNAIEAALIARLAGIPIRLGYNSDGRGWLLTHSIQRTKAVRKIHQTFYYLEMLKALGLQPVENKIQLELGAEIKVLSEQIFRKSGLSRNDLIIGMAPGAAYGPAKRWPAERFAEVALKLIRTHSAKIILLGSEGDRDITDAIARSSDAKTIINLAGQTSLREAMSVISECAIFISNDSGLMHIAGALNIPTIAIFGSTNPVTTSPVGDHCMVIRKDLSCSPCLKKECASDFKCMTSISAEEVFDAARKMIEVNKLGR